MENLKDLCELIDVIAPDADSVRNLKSLLLQQEMAKQSLEIELLQLKKQSAFYQQLLDYAACKRNIHDRDIIAGIPLPLIADKPKQQIKAAAVEPSTTPENNVE